MFLLQLTDQVLKIAELKPAIMKMLSRHDHCFSLRQMFFCSLRGLAHHMRDIVNSHFQS